MERSRKLYQSGLGLDVIGAFEDHQGFNGVMLGKADVPWHLEFTQCTSHPVIPSPSSEDLLVLYLPERDRWQQTCQQMVLAGFVQIESFNPYWDQNGKTYQDHDGYRTVIQCQQWP
nr:VOC family protein [Pantoea sp. S61]